MLPMPSSEKEWHQLVDDVLERRCHSYVQAAMAFARRFVLDEREKQQLVENLSSVQVRCFELLEQRQELARLISGIAEANEDKDRLLSEALAASRNMQ
jgi:hypothetical protein